MQSPKVYLSQDRATEAGIKWCLDLAMKYQEAKQFVDAFIEMLEAQRNTCPASEVEGLTNTIKAVYDLQREMKQYGARKFLEAIFNEIKEGNNE